MSEAFARAVYNALVPAGVAAGGVAARFNPKLREALDGRRGFRERWSAFAASLDRQPIWFHVSSVGEFEQARPVITGLQSRVPDTPVVLTFSSPSGYHFARKREPLDGSTNLRFIDYLPVDTRANMRFCLNALDPSLLVLVKFDLWPNLIWETHDRGVPIVLIDATLSPSSRRLSGAGRLLYRPVYECLDCIMAISDDDAARFAESVPGHGGISVTGDTRFDRVAERRRQQQGQAFPYRRGDGRVVIAGSTWPRDEEHLLPALSQLAAADPALQFIVAPHEPSADHVDPLRAWAQSQELSCRTVSDGPRDNDIEARVVIIDAVGYLAEAYASADVAYVGGAFSTGVHSVIEPAIAGLPVVFGPRHDNAFEALRLIELGGGFCGRNQQEIHGALDRLLHADGALESAGAAAVAYVESQLGATEKCLAAIDEYL